ncbi:unnamed protein product [Amoebophrya sp. A120]|nr:unnamed protein product [Amoebophrya sp. A120]|eukprot:GSA120T00008525001.1
MKQLIEVVSETTFIPAKNNQPQQEQHHDPDHTPASSSTTSAASSSSTVGEPTPTTTTTTASIFPSLSSTTGPPSNAAEKIEAEAAPDAQNDQQHHRQDENQEDLAAAPACPEVTIPTEAENADGEDDPSNKTDGYCPLTCAVCQKKGEQHRKYTCPCCNRKTCSLKCSIKHKQVFKCSGKRTRFNDKATNLKLMNDKTIMQDYHFLDHVNDELERDYRNKESLEEKMKLQPTMTATQAKKKKKKKIKDQFLYRDTGLVAEAKKRRTRLLLADIGLDHAKKNNSFVDKTTGKIHWRLEWSFFGGNAEKEVFIDEPVDEDTKVQDLLARFLTTMQSSSSAKGSNIAPGGEASGTADAEVDFEAAAQDEALGAGVEAGQKQEDSAQDEQAGPEVDVQTDVTLGEMKNFLPPPANPFANNINAEHSHSAEGEHADVPDAEMEVDGLPSTSENQPLPAATRAAVTGHEHQKENGDVTSATATSGAAVGRPNKADETVISTEGAEQIAETKSEQQAPEEVEHQDGQDNQLQDFFHEIASGNIKVYLRDRFPFANPNVSKYNAHSRQVNLVEVLPDRTVKENLQGREVAEFPRFIVTAEHLEDQWPLFTELEKKKADFLHGFKIGDIVLATKDILYPHENEEFEGGEEEEEDFSEDAADVQQEGAPPKKRRKLETTNVPRIVPKGTEGVIEDLDEDGHWIDWTDLEGFDDLVLMDVETVKRKVIIAQGGNHHGAGGKHNASGKKGHKGLHGKNMLKGGGKKGGKMFGKDTNNPEGGDNSTGNPNEVALGAGAGGYKGEAGAQAGGDQSQFFGAKNKGEFGKKNGKGKGKKNNAFVDQQNGSFGSANKMNSFGGAGAGSKGGSFDSAGFSGNGSFGSKMKGGKQNQKSNFFPNNHDLQEQDQKAAEDHGGAAAAASSASASAEKNNEEDGSKQDDFYSQYNKFLQSQQQKGSSSGGNSSNGSWNNWNHQTTAGSGATATSSSSGYQQNKQQPRAAWKGSQVQRMNSDSFNSKSNYGNGTTAGMNMKGGFTGSSSSSFNSGNKGGNTFGAAESADKISMSATMASNFGSWNNDTQQSCNANMNNSSDEAAAAAGNNTSSQLSTQQQAAMTNAMQQQLAGNVNMQQQSGAAFMQQQQQQQMQQQQQQPVDLQEVMKAMQVLNNFTNMNAGQGITMGGQSVNMGAGIGSAGSGVQMNNMLGGGGGGAQNNMMAGAQNNMMMGQNMNGNGMNMMGNNMSMNGNMSTSIATNNPMQMQMAAAAMQQNNGGGNGNNMMNLNQQQQMMGNMNNMNSMMNQQNTTNYLAAMQNMNMMNNMNQNWQGGGGG